MEATFSVTAFPEQEMMRITLGGFFSHRDLIAFDRARLSEHARLRCEAGCHVTLVDLREMKIQAQELLPGFGAIIADPATRPRRLAFVMTGSLARAQLKRIARTDGVSFFPDLPSAEAWLAEPAEGYALAG